MTTHPWRNILTVAAVLTIAACLVAEVLAAGGVW